MKIGMYEVSNHRFSWADLWSTQMAVQHILFNDEKMQANTFLASRLKNGLDLWFSGARGALINDEHLKEQLPYVSQVLAKIEERVRKVNSVVELRLPPAIWFRIFYDLAIPVPPQSLIGLAWWQFSNEAKGRYFLHKYWDEDKNVFFGPMHELTAKRGRTALEFLSGGLPDKIVSNAHAFEWIVESHASVGKNAPNEFSAHMETMSSKTKHPVIKKVEAKTAASAKSRKRRNVNALRTSYGSGCVEAVREALEQHVARRQSPIVKGSSDSRPYSTLLSMSELIELLQIKHQALARYSVSTLKPVLGFFIQTPRGKPPTLVELEELQTEVMKKAQRKKR